MASILSFEGFTSTTRTKRKQGANDGPDSENDAADGAAAARASPEPNLIGEGPCPVPSDRPSELSSELLSSSSPMELDRTRNEPASEESEESEEEPEAGETDSSDDSGRQGGRGSYNVLGLVAPFGGTAQFLLSKSRRERRRPRRFLLTCCTQRLGKRHKTSSSLTPRTGQRSAKSKTSGGVGTSTLTATQQGGSFCCQRQPIRILPQQTTEVQMLQLQQPRTCQNKLISTKIAIGL
eukprot:m.423628 g.423628  ORF g.423628 m.423628 type:complete len:237 (+) comp16856_c0_seq1:240-950(+)